MNILLLDDAEDTDLAIADEAVSHLGHTVKSTADPADFRKLAKAGGVDLQIVDHSLPNAEESVGLRDGPALVAVTAAEGVHVPTVFLTNWGADCTQRVAEFDPRLVYTVVEKPTLMHLQDWADSIESAIAQVQSQSSLSASVPLGIPADDLAATFFRLSVHELHSLSEDEREALEAEANLELHDLLMPVWDSCDADWIKLQREGRNILVTDRGADRDLPMVDAILASEEDHGSGSLTIGRPAIIEESVAHTTSTCTPGGHKNWHRYPYVRLFVGRRQREFHLDTGSHESYISRAFLSDAEVSVPRQWAKSRVVEDIGGRRDILSQLPVEVPLHVEGPEGNVAMTVAMQAVKNWPAATVLNYPCQGQRCPGSAGEQCGRRFGLMGRDLLYALPTGIWHFKPASGQFIPSTNQVGD